MKKVFAFLSVFALTIAFVGFGAKPAQAAGGLITEDPTLSENQIPMYIMDSIYTTFPNYYDYATAGDDKWEGVSRMYPWNETRFQCKLIDENGNFTGKEYAVYFSGSTSATSAGAGNNLLFYTVDAEGNVQLNRLSGELKYKEDGSPKWDSSGLPMDPSLSHMRSNISGQDVTFDALQLWGAYDKADSGANFYNRSLVFDGNGRMIRGIAPDAGYLLAGAEGAYSVTVEPEYCYVDGVVTKIEDGTVCDVEDVLDEETGEVKEQKTQYITNRFVFQYFSAEEFDPESVNTVPYLSEGWDAMKWDYVNEEEDGYVCIAFVSGANSASAFTLTAEQLAVYTETCAANGLEAPTATTARMPMRQITVPAGGWTYDYGYLDAGKAGLQEKYMDMFIDGYYYGRTVDEEGKGMAYQSTHDFSTSPIYAKDIQNNGVSYQVMDGQNVIEVLQGEVVYPTKNIVYSGMAKYWQTPGDFLSYKSDTSVLELYVKQDGVTVVQPATGYASFEDMVVDFMNDVNATVGAIKGEGYVPVEVPKLADGITTTGAFYATLNNNIISNNDTYNNFARNDEMWAKWSWLFEYMNTKLAAAAQIDLNKRTCPSPGNFTYGIWAFLTESPEITGWPASKADFSNGAAREWLDTRTNIEKWDQYCIDTSTAAVDTNYVVNFRAYNPNTNLETELTLTYVVVDEYTPILEVNKNNLTFAPKQVGEKLEMPVIDEYTFCTAYNARYNGSSIKGDNISYKVHYTSETLDFDNPTEGEHVVTAKVYNQTKWAEKSFVVSIEDMTAPRAFAVSSVTIGVGEYFNVLDAVIYAYDNVDGNLLDLNRNNWYYDASTKKLDVTKVGKYQVVLEIWDTMSNTTTVSYVVNVVNNQVNEELATSISANKQAIDNVESLVIENFEAINENFAAIQENFEAINNKFAEIDDKFAEVDDKLEEVDGKIDANQNAVNGKFDEVEENFDAVNGNLGTLNGKVDAIQAEFDSKCGSKNAIMVQFLAAASLLVVFLRKKH